MDRLTFVVKIRKIHAADPSGNPACLGVYTGRKQTVTNNRTEVTCKKCLKYPSALYVSKDSTK